jgi:UDP-2-acetamido-3-amino-2,3-dideoxy-glucuronate N-acetyltransferase
MVKLGHIGTGRWGIRLLQMMSRVASIKSCYGHQNRDSIPEGVRIVEDINDIVSDGNLDAVVIASPPETHYELGKKCLMANKNVFIEKPMCLSGKDARELVDLAAQRHLKLMVGFVYLYSNEYRAVKNNIANINNIRAYFLQTESKPGLSCLNNLGSHFIALALDLYGGNPVNVTINGDDNSAIMYINFVNGEAEIHASSKSGSQRRGVVFLHNEKILYDWNILRINFAVDDPLLNECRHFIDCIENNSMPQTDGLLGYKIIKLIMGELP